MSLNKHKPTLKKALVISPQSWGKMLISKHHYAIELAKLGYSVVFVNPPNETKFGSFKKISIQSSDYENISILTYTLFFSLYFKFHLPWLHNRLVKIQRWLILRKIGSTDLVISFDLSNNFPLKGLKCKKIFFAADEPKGNMNIISADNAELIVSVSQHILDLFKISHPKTPQFLINHGLCEEFLEVTECLSKKYEGINVGLSGNFLFNDIDYPKLYRICKANEMIQFHFYGAHSAELSNIGSYIHIENLRFLEKIKNLPNSIFHGVQTKQELAIELNQMDAFLICYDPINGQSSGSNSHKILEFLSTGKVVFSSYFSFYEKMTNLLEMKAMENFNEETIFSNLQKLNSPKLQEIRKEYARKNTYSLNCKQILSKIN